MRESETKKLVEALPVSHGSKEAADAMSAEISLNLTEEQRKELLGYIGRNARFPSVIEINFKADLARNTLFPVTVLVGAMA